MKNFKMFFITALIVFLDVAVTPNICRKKEYLIEYDIEVANFDENATLVFNYRINRYDVKVNQSLSKDETIRDIEYTINNGYYCEIINEDYIQKEIDITNINIIKITDINNDNEITFPYKLTKEKFSKFGNRYIVILKVIVELEYEFFEEPEI